MSDATPGTGGRIPLTLVTSPHLHSYWTTSRLMWAVVLCLLPSLGAGLAFFGLRSLALVVAAILGTAGSEWAIQHWRKQPFSLGDGSAVLAGLLLALVLPPRLPLPMAVLGGVALSGGLWLADPVLWPHPIFHLLAGGFLLGALFMATDLATSPMTPWGMWIFGFGAGFLTVLIRLIVGLSPDLSQTVGLKVLKDNETPRLGTKIREGLFPDQFFGRAGRPAPVLGQAELKVVKTPPAASHEVQAITGATISSKAVVRIINASVQALRAGLGDAAPAAQSTVAAGGGA